jgi:Fic family protein
MENATLSKKDQEERILSLLAQRPTGITAKDLLAQIGFPVPERTLQRRLAQLVKEKKVRSEGQTTQLRYFPPDAGASLTETAAPLGLRQISGAAQRLLNYLREPVELRTPVGYNRGFLDSYNPNKTSYLSAEEQARLAGLGRTTDMDAPAGTFARQILGRLLIDLAWNSSRLEGNTYSLLDTQRLLEQGTMSTDKSARETQMILNHKDAIEFIVDNADGAIRFNRYTLTSLHALLSNNLLPDPAASGRLRTFGVGITNSVYTPTAIPQLIEEMFDLILQKASAIENPFEQAFFAMVHLPYLQPFDDVNKRVSRLAANIPLNRFNLAPLSFTDVPQETYVAGLLGVYELNDVSLLKEIFLMAYERSAARYAAARQTLGEPDPFRLAYREQMRNLIRQIIREAMSQEDASGGIGAAANELPPGDQARFRTAVEEELLSLHEGNFARYFVTPSEYGRWREVWGMP